MLKTPRHLNPPKEAEFTPDGGRLVTHCSFRSPWVWELGTGKELLQNKTYWGSRYVLSRDGKLGAMGMSFGDIVIFDAVTGRELHTCRGHANYVNAVAISPDNRLVASAARDRTIRVWTAADGQLRDVLSPTRTRSPLCTGRPALVRRRGRTVVLAAGPSAQCAVSRPATTSRPGTCCATPGTSFGPTEADAPATVMSGTWMGSVVQAPGTWHKHRAVWHPATDRYLPGPCREANGGWSPGRGQADPGTRRQQLRRHSPLIEVSDPGRGGRTVRPDDRYATRRRQARQRPRPARQTGNLDRRGRIVGPARGPPPEVRMSGSARPASGRRPVALGRLPVRSPRGHRTDQRSVDRERDARRLQPWPVYGVDAAGGQGGSVVRRQTGTEWSGPQARKFLPWHLRRTANAWRWRVDGTEHQHRGRGCARTVAFSRAGTLVLSRRFLSDGNRLVSGSRQHGRRLDGERRSAPSPFRG